MSELQGQMSMSEMAPTAMPEGYDGNGQLMDYDPAADTAEADRLAVEINAIKAQTRNVVVSAALEIGKRLIRVRPLIPHGQWADWLSANVDYSETKARNLMDLYEAYGGASLSEAVAGLEYSKLVALLQLPEGQREAVAQRAADEGLSVRQLQAEIDRLKADAAQKQVTFDALLQQAADEAARAAEGALKIEREKVNLAEARAKAAEESAKASGDALKKAKKSSDAMAAKAGDALERAKEADQKAADLRARVAELEAQAAQDAGGDVPPEVQAELDRLRAQAAKAQASAEFEIAYRRFVADFGDLSTLLTKAAADAPEDAARYRAAVAKACETMAGRMRA